MPRFGIIQSKVLHAGNYTVGKNVSQNARGVVTQSLSGTNSVSLIPIGNFSPSIANQYSLDIKNFFMPNATFPNNKEINYVATRVSSDELRPLMKWVFSNANLMTLDGFGAFPTGGAFNVSAIATNNSVDLGSVGSTQQMRIYTA